MDWTNVVEKVTPYIIKINTPMGNGTGFIYMYNENKTFCGIATAWHVIDYADEWQQPIRIYQPFSGKSSFLPYDQRVIFPEWTKDSGVILIPYRDLIFPEKVIPLFPTNIPLGIGVEVGWLGFPAIEPYTLCFFSGKISARQDFRNAYLIDGVAINGVSGGPVVYPTSTEGVQIVGTVSAYRPSRAGGDVLPGLLIAQDVSHFHEIINRIKSMDEAARERAALERAQKSPSQPTSQP